MGPDALAPGEPHATPTMVGFVADHISVFTAEMGWHEVTPRPVPRLQGTLVPMDQPLPPLGQYLLGIAITLDTKYTGHVPDLDPKTATGRQADDYMNDRQARIWPGLVR